MYFDLLEQGGQQEVPIVGKRRKAIDKQLLAWYYENVTILPLCAWSCFWVVLLTFG